MTGFRERANALMERLPHDWDIVLWGFDHAPRFVWVDFGFSKAKLEFYDVRWSNRSNDFKINQFSSMPIKIAHALATYGYSVSPKGARYIVGFLSTSQAPIDFVSRHGRRDRGSRHRQRDVWHLSIDASFCLLSATGPS